MWEAIKQFFVNLFNQFNSFLANTLQLDQLVVTLYNDYIAPIPEIFKILGIVFLVIILVFGVIAFVRKLLKLFIVLAVILGIVLIVTRLL